MNNQEEEIEDFEDFPEIGGIMASKMVTEEGKPPRLIYREKRANPNDSGWRVLSDLEEDDYLNDPENTGIYSPATILKIDPTIQYLLFEGVGSVFEKTDDNTDWERDQEFKLQDDYEVEHKLNSTWSLTINNLFERMQEESGDVMYTTGDKSMRLAMWGLEGQSKAKIYADHQESIKNREESEFKTLKTFELSDSSVSRLGYMIEEEDGFKSYRVIYGFSIIEEELIQLAFYFDDEDDESWALETWKNITIDKQKESSPD